MERVLTIMLADDHALVREGVAGLINAQPDMKVIGQVDAGAALLAMVATQLPDVVVVDVAMPGAGGIEVTKQLHQQFPSVHVLALSRHSEEGYVQQMLQAGALGYVYKQETAAELVAAIRTVAAGEKYLAPVLSRPRGTFVPPQVPTSTAQPHTLSPEEQQVAQLVASGRSNQEIAQHLDIALQLVETAKNQAMHKLGVSSRAGLVRYALAEGWLNLS